jgi:hypothetical protein
VWKPASGQPLRSTGQEFDGMPHQRRRRFPWPCAAAPPEVLDDGIGLVAQPAPPHRRRCASTVASDRGATSSAAL